MKSSTPKQGWKDTLSAQENEIVTMQMNHFNDATLNKGVCFDWAIVETALSLSVMEYVMTGILLWYGTNHAK